MPITVELPKLHPAAPPSVAIARFGLGIGVSGRNWGADARSALLAELDAPPELPAREGQLQTGAALYGQVRSVQMLRRTAKGADDTDYRAAQRALQQAIRADGQYRIRMAQAAPTGIVERLVAFWSNHFAIAAKSNALLRGMAGAYEREAIRPYILGRFADLVLAATQHPAMLTYLNNAVSIGPSSRLGLRREKGLNENHARRCGFRADADDDSRCCWLRASGPKSWRAVAWRKKWPAMLRCSARSPRDRRGC